MKFVLCVAMSVSGVATAHAIETTAKNAIVVDHNTGVTLYEKEADAIMYPASMTKMMTAYMMFEALDDGQVSLDTRYNVSEKAWRKGGSKMFVGLNTNIAVADLMRGIVIQSGNDACIVFAEGFAGGEDRFAERMTLKARELGMKNTVFKNATGWPDEEHVTTARDLSILAQATINEFPQYYSVYREREYSYNNIKQRNRNLLLGRNLGVDGLKTGHTEAAGYGITISGIRDGRRVNVVVGGLNSELERANEAEKLFRYAYSEFSHVALGDDGTSLDEAPVWYGTSDVVKVVAESSATLVLPTVETDSVRAEIIYDKTLKAPIQRGERLGVLKVTSKQLSRQDIPVFAGDDVPRAGFMKRSLMNLRHLLGGE